MIVICLVGLSCSGKTTIGSVIADELKAEYFDGDLLRETPFGKGVGYEKEDRRMNLLRVSYMINKLSKYNRVVWACGCPYNDILDQLPIDMLVFCKSSIEKCKERDVKGFWKRAASGEMKNLPGVDMPYDEPRNPDLVLDTENKTVRESIQELLKGIKDFEAQQ